MKNKVLIAAVATGLAGCTTTSEQFYADPSGQDTTALCRAYGQSVDDNFRRDVYRELQRRDIPLESCQNRVAFENAAAIGVAAIGAAVLIGAAANGGGGHYGGGSYGVAWDQFYGPYGNLMWACRDRATGRFVEEWRCSNIARVDAWPGWHG